MSFIDVMKDIVWSDADITHRTEAMLRAEFSVEQELILNRKMQGVAAGVYALTPDEQAEVAKFQAAVFAAQQAGVVARSQMVLLNATLEYEAAQRRLAQAAVGEGAEIYEQDQQERAEAAAVVNAATLAVIDLANLRRG